MTKPLNIREIALEILMEITEEQAYSHVVMRQVLEKYQYLLQDAWRGHLSI